MTRTEAMNAMMSGKKITHEDFTSGEYFYVKNYKIVSEDGYDFSELFYTVDFYADGWSVFEGK